MIPSALPSCRIAVVVLNYGTPDLALQAAESAVRNLDPEQDRVLIVDNKSPDNSVERIEAGLLDLDLPHVSLIESPRNGGFAAGNNVGIRSVQAEAYVLLNSDTIVREGALARLHETLNGDPRIGICSPRLEFEDGEAQISCFRAHSPVSELLKGASTGILSKALESWEVPLGVKDSLVDVTWTSFACVMIRREVFDTIGLLDEGFFMYYEDADFCRLTRQGDFRIVHDPTARVVHLRGKSSPVKEATRLRQARPQYYYEARNRYFRRAYGPLGALAANSLWTLGRALALPREAIGQKPPHTVKNELKDNWKSTFAGRDS